LTKSQVLIGVNAASCIAVLASILAFWIPYAVEHWGRAAITSNGTESNTGTEPAAPKSATATATAISEGSSIQATLSRRKTTHTEAEFFISGAPTPTYPRPPKKQPNGLTSTEQFIFNLGDLNLATSLAIIISSMVNIHTNPHYPLYHIFIARALASSAIIGHNSTTFVYTKFQQKRTYSLWIRWFLSLSALVLYTIWCGQALSKFQEQDKQREWKFMPFCLSAGGNIVPGSWTGWIWFNRLEMPFTFFWIIMSPFPWSSVVDETIQRLDAFTFGRFRAIIVDYWKDVSWIGQEQRQATAWNYVTTFVHNFLVAAVKTLLTLLWILVCVLLIPCDSVMPLSQGLFGILWNIYDIYTIRKGNAGVVVNVLSTPDWPNTENPEEKWGFGQIFPVVMLLQIFITFLDYALGKQLGVTAKSSHKLT
jgi:hypothetical protein